MLNRQLTSKRYILLSMLVLAICGCVAMMSMDGNLESNLIAYAYICTLIFLIPGVLFSPAIPKSRLFRNITILLIWMACVTFFRNKTNVNLIVFHLTSVLIPALTIKNAYSYTEKYGIDKSFPQAALMMMLIVTAQYFLIYNTALMDGGNHLITSYYPMFILPLVLLHPSKIIRAGAILLVTFVIFSSLKRGGVIALAVGLITYILSDRYVNGKGAKSFFYAILSLGILAGIFGFLALGEYSEITERMMNINDDEGSGRISVWTTTWEMIANSSTVSYIIGHGFNAVRRDSILELSAHNDFLEAWYDFGLIGLVLFAMTILSIIKHTFRLLLKKSAMAPIMAMTMAIMLTLTMISHVLIYYFMTFICLNVGIIAGASEHNENNQ